jgi:hypothetical protein
MISEGADSNEYKHPIRVDSSGRPYVILTDGTETLNIDSSNRAEVSVLNVKPDGTYTMPAMDHNTRAGFITLTDGSHDLVFNVVGSTEINTGFHPTVICLNFVKDGDNWVPMTQS